jgi:hypothetical protein
MNEADNNLSIDQTARLLRLYLTWPVHSDQPAESEAQEFYNWLVEELDEASLVEITGGVDGVLQFLEANTDVISAGKQAKTAGSEKLRNAREEQRISTVSPVFVVVYDCEKAPLLEGTSLNGMMMDMARNGMRLESDVAVPAGSIVTMTVVSDSPVTLYHLTGEVRWISHSNEVNQIGISIFDMEDYVLWQKHFAASFGQTQ